MSIKTNRVSLKSLKVPAGLITGRFAILVVLTPHMSVFFVQPIDMSLTVTWRGRTARTTEVATPSEKFMTVTELVKHKFLPSIDNQS